MQEERLLDDVRYAEALVRMLTGRGQGPQRVRHALNEAGLPPEAVSTALDTAPDWKLLAADVRRRKFGAHVPKDWPGRARQAADRTTVIHIDIHPTDWTEGNGSWWECGTPEVSEREAVRAARKEFEAGKKKQRVGV